MNLGSMKIGFSKDDFVGEGFAYKTQLMVMKMMGLRLSRSIKGYIKDILVEMQRPEVFHIEERLLHTSAPISLYITAFQVHGFSKDVGATSCVFSLFLKWVFIL